MLVDLDLKVLPGVLGLRHEHWRTTIDPHSHIHVRCRSWQALKAVPTWTRPPVIGGAVAATLRQSRPSPLRPFRRDLRTPTSLPTITYI